jgi:hypothetical protein
LSDLIHNQHFCEKLIAGGDKNHRNGKNSPHLVALPKIVELT